MVNPKIWGRSGWKLIFRYAHNTKDAEAIKLFLCKVTNMLPCDRCFKHAKEMISCNDMYSKINDYRLMLQFIMALYNFSNPDHRIENWNQWIDVLYRD